MHFTSTQKWVENFSEGAFLSLSITIKGQSYKSCDELVIDLSAILATSFEPDFHYDEGILNF